MEYFFEKKPLDFDSVIYGNTRFVIFEKTSETSQKFYTSYALKYQLIAVRKTISILDALSSNLEKKYNILFFK